MGSSVGPPTAPPRGGGRRSLGWVHESAFADSTQSTLGIEWEVALVDAATGDLRSEAPAILHELHKEAGLAEGEDHPHVTGELLQNTVELVTGVHEAVPTAVAELGTIA
ncbi:hypothetical protein E4A41_12960, partial [Micrococcus endophyticus]